MKRRLYMAAAAWLALTASGAHATAQVAADPCVSPQEAEALVTVLMPKVIAAVQVTCSTTLPADSYLRTRGDALVERYEAAGKAAEPAGTAAFGKIAGETMTPDMFAMMGPMMAIGVAGAIKPKDCGRIDQIVGLLDPLPPANLSALAVAVLELSSEGEKSPPIRICKTTVRVKG